MAKQTFTTGQVLTAAQMTSLQQTAMLGGAASAKTASYTLVAADAGTAISMNSASATTITVNTALFAAGDTVQITNLGAGVCTVTAGTATVNTSASLALAQYESGTLNFTSTSAAIFIKGAGAAASSGGMTLLSTTALTGSSLTVGSINTGYNELYVEMRNIRVSIDNRTLKLRFNSDTGSNYNFMKLAMDTGSFVSGASSTTNVEFGYANSSTTASTLGQLSLRIPLYASTTYNKSCYFFGGSVNPSGQQRMMGQANYASTSAITSITVFPDAGTWDAGDILIYGVK